MSRRSGSNGAIDTKIIDLDSRRPHVTAHVGCKACKREWQAVYPVGARELECPGCFKKVKTQT